MRKAASSTRCRATRRWPKRCTPISAQPVSPMTGKAGCFARARGHGSGVVFAPDGFVLTNHHVIEHGERFSVSLPDGLSRTATMVGGDAATDLALLRVAGGDLPYAEFGQSSGLCVGQLVIA